MSVVAYKLFILQLLHFTLGVHVATAEVELTVLSRTCAPHGYCCDGYVPCQPMGLLHIFSNIWSEHDQRMEITITWDKTEW